MFEESSVRSNEVRKNAGFLSSYVTLLVASGVDGMCMR